MGFGQTCSKVILSIFNSVFFLVSAVLLVVGIFVKVGAGTITSLIPNLVGIFDSVGLNIDINGLLASVGNFIIIIGAIGVFIAGLGLFGACCMIRWILIIYVSLMIALTLGEIALIIFATAFSSQFKTTIQNILKSTLSNFQDVSINSSANSSSISLPSDITSLSWTIVQIAQKCCGAFGYKDYAEVSWTRSAGLVSSNISAVVPISCCSYNGTFALSTSSFSSFNNITGCLQGNPAFINNQNCYDAVTISGMMVISSNVAIGIAAGIIATELILIVLSFVEYFASRARKT